MVEDEKILGNISGVPRCLKCRHFPDCMTAYVKDRNFFFSLECEEFEEGDWWENLAFERKVEEVELPDGTVEEHYVIVDGRGRELSRSVRRTVPVERLLKGG